jgi:nitronate monooxygenase
VLPVPIVRFVGGPIRQWEAGGSALRGARPNGEVVATAADGSPLLRYSVTLPGPGMTGDVEALALYAGQSVGLISRLQSAEDIVKSVADETIRTLQQCMQLLPQGNASSLKSPP